MKAAKLPKLQKYMGASMFDPEPESVTKGIDNALAFASRDKDGAGVHDVKLAVVDVAQVRQQTGLSQAEFAKSIGVAKGTLLNWEHGRRNPTGPARVLLALIAKKPSVVQELLGKV